MDIDEFLRKKIMEIKELDFQLKYFYLINTDCIIEDLQSNNLYKNFKENSTGLLDVFHLIFSKMIEATKPYTEFILSSHPGSSLSLFGEIPGITEISVLFFLCEASLFHHCIIQGFKNSLNEHIIQTGKQCTKCFLDFGSKNPIIKFSVTTMPAIRKGCLHSFNNSQKYSPQCGSTEHQQFNGQCKRVLNNTADYSTQLIQQYRQRPENTSDEQLFTAKTESAPVAFLFDSREVKFFNTVLKQKKIQCTDFLSRYNVLYNAYFEESSALSSTDQILFDIVLEQAYGFSLFSYIYELLYNMENSESFEKIAALRGEMFYSIISDYLATLPITYNRAVLLKYACKAISNSPNLVSMYPKKPEIMAYYETFTPKPKISFATEALQIMNSFFRLLNYSVLPLLENLWLVLTDRLGISFENYCDFIEKYHSIMTYDYTCLPATIFEKKHTTTFCDYYNILHTYVLTNEKFFSTNTPFFNKDSKHTLGNIYKYDFCNTIKQQCTTINPPLRKDIVHRLLEPLKYRQDNYFDEQQEFLSSHAKNIYKFTQSLDWDALSKKQR